MATRSRTFAIAMVLSALFAGGPAQSAFLFGPNGLEWYSETCERPRLGELKLTIDENRKDGDEVGKYEREMKIYFSCLEGELQADLVKLSQAGDRFIGPEKRSIAAIWHSASTKWGSVFLEIEKRRMTNQNQITEKSPVLMDLK